jgi:hypothetical protein
MERRAFLSAAVAAALPSRFMKDCRCLFPPAWSATALPHYLAQGAANCCGHRGGSSRMSGGSGFGQDAIHAGDT